MTPPSDDSNAPAGGFPVPAGQEAAAAPPRQPSEPNLAEGAARPSLPPSESGALGRTIAVGVLAAAAGAVIGFVAKPPPLEETRFINFDPETAPQTVLTAGWSGFEQLQPAGDTFVWCAAQTCKVHVEARPESDRLVRVRAMPYRFPGAPPQTLTVYVNETQLGTKPLGEGMTVMSFKATRSFWTKGPNELRFEFAYAEDPKSKSGGDDPRKLAAGFDWVEIAPL